MCGGEDRGAEPPQARVQGSVPHTRQPGRTAKSLQMVKYRGGRVEAHACGLLTSALPFHRSVQGSTVLKTETERVGDELDSQPQVDRAAIRQPLLFRSRSHNVSAFARHAAGGYSLS